MCINLIVFALWISCVYLLLNRSFVQISARHRALPCRRTSTHFGAQPSRLRRKLVD